MRDIVVNDEKCQKKANKIHPETNNIIFNFLFKNVFGITLLAPLQFAVCIFLASLVFVKNSNIRWRCKSYQEVARSWPNLTCVTIYRLLSEKS